MAVEGNGYVPIQHSWISVRDDADGVDLDWAPTGVAFSGDSNPVHKCSTRSGDYLASVGGRIAEADYTLHGFPFAMNTLTVA